MKRRVLAGILILLSCIMCVACDNAKKSSHKEEKTSITIWHYYSGSQKAAFDRMVERFNETEGIKKGITVNVVAMDSISNLSEQINASADKKVGAKALPDLFSAYVDMAETIDAKGLLVDMDQYFSKEELSGYVDAYIEEGRFDSAKSLKLFPIAKATEVMMVNKTKWDEFASACNIDVSKLSTWEGLAETAELYYDWSGGKAMFGRDVAANYMLLGSLELGNDIFQIKDGTLDFQMDKDVMRKLWDNYYVPYISGYYRKEGRYASDDLKIGDIIAYVGSTTSAAYFPDEVYYDAEDTGTQIECMVLPVPDFEGKESYVIQQGAGMAMIHSDEKKEKASAEFLKWFTESEKNVSFAVESCYLPVTKESCHADYIRNIVEKENVRVSDKVLDTLTISIEKMNQSTTYTLPSFENSYDAREVLETTLKDKAKNDRAAVLELTAQGMTEEDAVAQYDTEDSYQAWYQDTVAQINRILNPEK